VTLGRTAKVVIGVLTIVVTLLPIIFSLLWAHAFSRFLAYPPSEMGGLRPFAGVLSSTEPFLLLATALSLGMAVFYAAHVIRNQDLPAYVRVCCSRRWWWSLTFPCPSTTSCVFSFHSTMSPRRALWLPKRQNEHLRSPPESTK